MKMLNIGCGSLYHHDWINLDIASTDPSVIIGNACNGLPFQNSSLSVCYSSHMLEHLSRNQAANLLRECYRVLEVGGILRIVVPDLERTAREYVAILNELDNKEVDYKHNWIMVELLDQLTREGVGGQMLPLISNAHGLEKNYIESRIGRDLNNLESVIPSSQPLYIKLKPRLVQYQQKLRVMLVNILMQLILGKEVCASFQKGLYRDSGEVHRWMYDRYSLGRLLKEVGFAEIQVCNAFESRIPNFASYELDEKNGFIRKPDSLFVEAVKPNGNYL
jgi:predicted SAM-dependent methyltransferase